MVGTSRSEIRALASEDTGPCVSVLLPTHRVSKDTRQDLIRFQNLVAVAEERLEERSIRGAQAAALLDPMRRLVDEDLFRRPQGDGLALYSSSVGFRRVQLPYPVDELAEVGERFVIKPLVPVLSGDARFHILALSQHKARLFEGSRHHARELSVNLPQSVEEAPGIHEHAHAGGPPSTGRRDVVAVADVRKDEVARFCRSVDDRVLAGVDRSVPLVVAAVDWVAGLYRDVSKHPAIVEEVVEGNPDTLSAEALALRAFPVVEPRLREPERQTARRLGVALHHAHASADVDAIVEAAADGRVDALFVALDRPQWGRFDPSSRRVQMHHIRGDGDEDMVNLAAVFTLRHDGAVYAPMPEDLRANAAAALFRY